MEVGLGQIERAGGRAEAGGQAFGPTTVVTTHTEDGADIAVSLAPSVVSRRLLKSELSWEAIAREAVRPTVFGLPAFGIMDDGVVEFQIGLGRALADPP